jgi:hypothetical protein
MLRHAAAILAETGLITMKTASSPAGLRRAVLAAAAAAAVAGAVIVATAAAAPVLASPASRAGGGELAAGQSGTRAGVPWSRIGPGWTLVLYSASKRSAAGPTTLYLVDPAGGRYSLETWAARAAQSGWQLQDWSPGGRQALFVSGGYGSAVHVREVALRTGATSGFTLPASETVIGYARSGRSVLTQRGTPDGLHSKQQVRTYSLTGRLQSVLASVEFLGGIAQQRAGHELAAGSLHGLELISSSGGVIRSLPVPGANQGCTAVRWWSSSAVLASCQAGNGEPRLWLVPAGGAAATALTPQRSARSRDYGDFNAWQLPAGLYLDAYGACGVLNIAKAEPHGRVKILSVPGSQSNLVVNATRTRLLVERSSEGCMPGVSLAWFNPVTRAVTVAIPARGVVGVTGAVPYFVAGKF